MFPFPPPTVSRGSGGEILDLFPIFDRVSLQISNCPANFVIHHQTDMMRRAEVFYVDQAQAGLDLFINRCKGKDTVGGIVKKRRG